MSRRRYISSRISHDTKVNRLAVDYGDFAALFYTWLITHAGDDGIVHGAPDEIMALVAPMRRDKSIEDVTHALEGIDAVGLAEWRPAEGTVVFPAGPFYTYQSYVSDKNRRRAGPENGGDPAPSYKESGEQRKSPENAASVTPSVTVSSSPSPTPSLSPSPSSSAVAGDVLPCAPAQRKEPPSLPDEVDSVLIELEEPLDDAARRRVRKVLNRLPHLDGESVAQSYMQWQRKLTIEYAATKAKNAKPHKDRIGGWANNMERAIEHRSHWKQASKPALSVVPSSPLEEIAAWDEEAPLNPSGCEPFDIAKEKCRQECRSRRSESWKAAYQSVLMPVTQAHIEGTRLVILAEDEDHRRLLQNEWAEWMRKALSPAGFPDLQLAFILSSEVGVA